MLATYLALGYTNEECAKELDITRGRVEQIKHSPLLQHEIEQERRRIRERITADALGLLQQEAVPSVRRLVGLRDQDDNRTVALGATNSILDRVVPKTTRLEEDRTFRIVFDAEILTDMREAMIEDGAFVDVEEALAPTEWGAKPAVAGLSATESRVGATAVVASLADVLAELQRAEARERVAEDGDPA